MPETEQPASRTSGEVGGRKEHPPSAGPADWDTKLRERGYRVTPARRLVLQALAEMSHATGEQILAHIGPAAPDLNLSTVYRTLDVLSEVGLVTHAHFQHGVVTYHAVGGQEHIHLVCRGCGEVSSVPAAAAAEFTAEVARQTGFRADISHLTLHGHCARCGSGRAAGPQVFEQP